ncbi:MAG: hypothetical protein IT580_18815 [Verrucomicrobiales bacterium]|nr:hypothetical protein [Verrucomicrobiales bacterium]
MFRTSVTARGRALGVRWAAPLAAMATAAGALVSWGGEMAASEPGLESRIGWWVGGVVAVAAGSVAMAIPLSRRLNRRHGASVLDVTRTARLILEQKDYSVRAARTGSDEMQDFADAFNRLLDQVQGREVSLQAARTRLEHQAQALEESIRRQSARESESAGWEALLETCPLVVLRARRSGTLDFLNAAGRDWLGLAAGEAWRARRLGDLFPAAAGWTEREAGERWETETELVAADGRSVPVRVVGIVDAEAGQQGGGGLCLMARKLVGPASSRHGSALRDDLGLPTLQKVSVS